MTVELNVNRTDYQLEVAPDEKLIDTLRDRLHITSVKRGCENGDCGACTVLVDGEAVASCIYLTVQARHRRILTIEAFGAPGRMHPIQEELKRMGAFQCGFCAPGMTLSIISLLEREPSPSEEAIREAISGNLCRCSGYVQIVDAVKAYAERTKNSYEGKNL